MTELLKWLEGTGLAAIARESLYGFQILVGVHILGLIFSVGILLWVDLRMLGVSLMSRPLPDVYAALYKWFLAGFAVMFMSGVSLFAGFATSAYENVYFRIKILVMVLAGINAVVFHVLLRQMPAKNGTEIPSGPTRTAAVLSIMFWATVVLCGRMMSYTLF